MLRVGVNISLKQFNTIGISACVPRKINTLFTSDEVQNESRLQVSHDKRTARDKRSVNTAL